MIGSKNSDALLRQIYAELESVLRIYSASCEAVEKAERENFDSASIQSARLRQQSMGMQWRLAVRQMAQLTPRTKRGSFAKNLALHLCFRHNLAEDGDVMDLARSHVADLNQLLDEDGELSMSELPLLTSRQTTS